MKYLDKKIKIIAVEAEVLYHEVFNMYAAILDKWLTDGVFMFRNLVSLAIFYVLPVIQLVITYQSVSAYSLVSVLVLNVIIW